MTLVINIMSTNELNTNYKIEKYLMIVNNLSDLNSFIFILIF